MSYFDDYYNNDVEPEQEPENYIDNEPVQPVRPKRFKERRGLRKVGTVVLAVALVAASSSTTAVLMNHRWEKEMNILTQQMNDKINAMQKTTGQTAASNVVTGSPLAAGEYLTPGQVYAQNVDAVVVITAQVEKYDSYGRVSSGISTGTGFIITDDGYVVTNYHVVEGGKKITVTTNDDDDYVAELIGYEENNDLAVLKINQVNLPYATIGSSSELQVGDQVVAIGNALGSFNSSLTVGYVSGVDRVVDTKGTAMNMIQTDVAINSGNSGGPLFNMKGEVVGITTAKFSGNSASGVGIEGIGFAIPMDDVTGMIEDLKEFGYVSGAYLGVEIEDVESTAQFYGIPAGAYVEAVVAGSAAEKAGIVAKDIITEVGGFSVTSVSDLTRVLRKFAAGETISVEIYREGQMKTVTVTLDEKPREESQTQIQPEQQQPQQMPSGDSFEDMYDFFREFFG